MKQQYLEHNGVMTVTLSRLSNQEKERYFRKTNCVTYYSYQNGIFRHLNYEPVYCSLTNQDYTFHAEFYCVLAQVSL